MAAPWARAVLAQRGLIALPDAEHAKAMAAAQSLTPLNAAELK